MKTDSIRPLVFVITAFSLGSMVSIAGSHYFYVKQVVIQNEKESSKVEALEKELVPTEEEIAAAHAAKLQQEHNKALLGILKEMRAEQLNMQGQLAETGSKLTETGRSINRMNGDLSKVNFRLDTHSESFRPLKVDQSSRPRKLDSGADGVEVDIRPNSGLLPPIIIK